MSVKVFYSWQSTTEERFNKFFIAEVLEASIRKLKKSHKKVEYSDIVIDRDTKGVPGSPNIPNTIHEKIASCQIFVADLTVVNRNSLRQKLFKEKVTINNNVLIEYGQAKATVTENAVITFFNEAYAELDEMVLPFDIRQSSFPIRYTLSKRNWSQREQLVDTLSTKAAEHIKEIIDFGLKNPSTKYYPFLDWTQWSNEFSYALNIEYVSTERLDQIGKSIFAEARKPRTVQRLTGLSGLGKTRLVYEAFNPKKDTDIEFAKRVLYLDLNQAHVTYKDVLFKLSETNTEKILVLDSCSQNKLADIFPIVQKSTSKLSVIAIDHNVPISPLDHDSRFTLVELNQSDFETVIDEILRKFFPKEEDESERTQIKKFANGHTLIATLLAKGKRESKDHWIPIITQANVLDKILGEFGTIAVNRRILRCIAIFERLGYFDERQTEVNIVANNALLTKSTLNERSVEDFRSVCTHYLKKDIIERQARYIAIRTKPIALTLAVEWWQDCDADYATRLFTSLREETALITSLTEQLKYLDFLENCREIVEQFVLPDGPFGEAEVLNTEEGSRLFRSFVEVNPQSTVAALQRLFLPLNREQMLGISAGRRNLIWALEMLVFPQDTFRAAAIVLLHFAVAENEDHIVNNATGQFLQLFQAFLPGTEASYAARVEIIEYALERGGEFAELGVRGLMRAMKARDFHRSGGAEHQGSRPQLKDFPRTNEEASTVGQYWDFCAKKLFQYAKKDDSLGRMARGTLINSVRQMYTAAPAFNLIPFVQEIARSREDKILLKRELKSILKFDRKAISAEEATIIKGLIDRLSPVDFEGMYIEAIRSSQWDEDEVAKDLGFLASLQGAASRLAKLFLSDYDATHLRLFYDGPQQNGLFFGEALAANMGDLISSFRFLEESLDVLDDMSSENIDLNVLAGFIKGQKTLEVRTEMTELVFNHKRTRPYMFQIVARTKPAFSTVLSLLDCVAVGEFSVSEFLHLEFGGTLNHLHIDNVKELYQRIATISVDGVRVSFSLAFMYTYNDEARFSSMRGEIRSLLLTKGLLDKGKVSVDRHKWGDTCERFLNDGDTEVAAHLVSEIVSLCEGDSYIGVGDYEIKHVLGLLLAKYFAVAWPKVSDTLLREGDQYMVYHQMKALIGSHLASFGRQIGTLFSGDLEAIFSWCVSNSPLAPNRIINIAPIFDETVPGKWHPFTRKMIDAFGDDSEFLRMLDANLGTFSWTGSLVPLLEAKVILMSDLTGHASQNVAMWAAHRLQYFKDQIRKEQYQDVEGYNSLPGT